MATKTKHPKTDAQMRCQQPGCRRRSKGPRFHWLCDKHIDVQKEFKKQMKKRELYQEVGKKRRKGK